MRVEENWKDIARCIINTALKNQQKERLMIYLNSPGCKTAINDLLRYFGAYSSCYSSCGWLLFNWTMIIMSQGVYVHTLYVADVAILNHAKL